MVQVKVCGITSLDDALAAVEAGADLLGFNFYRRSPRYILPADAQRIVEVLPWRVSCVGVFVNEDAPGDVLRIAEEAGVSAVQLHGDESPEFCRSLGELTTIKALRVGEGFSVEGAARFEADAILLDTHVKGAWGGTGRTFDWSLARRTREVVGKLFLAGGLTPDNVAVAVAAVEPFAVDVCSGVESAPGRKSVVLLRRFIETAKNQEGEMGKRENG